MDKEKLERIKDLVAEVAREIDGERRKDPSLESSSSLVVALKHHIFAFDDPLAGRMLCDEPHEVFMRIGEALRKLTDYYSIDTKEALFLMMWPPEMK